MMSLGTGDVYERSRLGIQEFVRKKEERMRFKDKVCLVTGGGSGIGRAVCALFAAEGGQVAVVNRSAEKGNATVQAITQTGGQAILIQADVGMPAQLQAAVTSTVARWGRIDILVNNAAMMTFTPIVDLSVEEWDQLMAVNLRAVFLGCKYALPHMQHGAIVNVSSVHAFETTANVVPYAASKGGVEAFTRGLSIEVEAPGAGQLLCARRRGYAHALVEPQCGERQGAPHGHDRAAREHRRRHRLSRLGRGVLHQRRHPGRGRRPS